MTGEKGRFEVKEKKELKYFVIPKFEKINLAIQAFTTRPFNLGLHVGDKKEDVLKNRKRISRALGINPEDLVCAQQVHENKISIITEKEKGKGAMDYQSSIPETDGLLTNVRHIPLTVACADCIALFVLDPAKKAIGLIHIGWKGVQREIAKKTVFLMKKHYGSNPRDLLIGISPHIYPCCYKTDKEHPDLEETVSLQLREQGVREENIIPSKLCTVCQKQLFFSHRRDGKRSGRMLAIMMLK